jgi:enolase
MAIISKISSRWILDSRGIPTVWCSITIEQNNIKYTGQASVPSGASTGTHEALELRDNVKDFDGKGVTKAIDNLINQIGKAIIGKEFESAKDLDKFVLEMEESLEKQDSQTVKNMKTVLGANAILGVSMAGHRSFAKSNGQELWQYLREIYFSNIEEQKFPRLMCNIFNGGAHASNNLDIQEFMVIPNSGNIENDVQMSCEIYQTLKKILKKQGQSTSVGDEGGFAPNYNGTAKVLESIATAINDAGFSNIVCDLGLDCAASEFFNPETKMYSLDGVQYSQSALTDFYFELADTFNILSIEDPFAEDDILGWELISAKMGKKRFLIGDDLFVTNIERFKNIGLKNQVANGVLIKLNQIGSVLETAQMINLAKENNYITAISHRSGETNDDFISDLAFACQSEFIKLGAPARGERVAKYNRLLQISDTL